MTTVLCVPQWQGSAAERAPHLVAGARRTAEIVAAGTTRVVPVDERSGVRGDGVRALDVLVDNRERIRRALIEVDGPVLTVGGDCSVDLEPICAAHARYGDRLTVLWVDAHPDVYAPSFLPSGAFHGMVVRALLGDGPAALNAATLLRPDQVVIAGERANVAGEHAYLAEKSIRTHGVEDMEAAFASCTGPVYVHLDLDVLDPVEFGAVGYPEPGGVSVDRLAGLLGGLDGVVGAAVTEHAPSDDVGTPAEAEIIRRLVAAIPL